LAGLLAWAEGTRPDGGGAAAPPFVPHARVSGSAEVYTTSVTLPTYPYAGCLGSPQTGVAGVPYQALDWDCFFDAGPPVPQTYTLLVLSNDYLTVTLLPELGGRVYELVFKPTGSNELYRNPVVKPSPWGPPEQGWGLAVGGMEWDFPTDEHGYEWGIPWRYRVVEGTAGVTVTLRDSDAVTRPTVAVAVHLPADRAALVVRPQIANPTAADVGLKYWTNALLAPGAANAPSADLRFLFPGDQVIVHSTGDADLPPAGELMDWPVHDGRDYGRLGEWDQWLGFFEAPQAHGPFAGVYDTAADEGVLRIYPADVVSGSKGFAFGWNDPLPSYLWTDDDSAYVEVHGGLMPTFWDTATLSPGQIVSWTEVWYPVAGIGGISVAGEEAALRLERLGDALAVGLYTPAAHEDVDLYLWRDDCTTLGHWRRSRVDPAHPIVFALPAGGLTPDELSLVALSADGALLGGVNPRDCSPPLASVEPLPFYVTTHTFTVTWRGEDAWSGIVAYDVQSRAGYEGRWTDWLTGTPAVSATFTGAGGRTYFFRARGRDGAGNVGAYGGDEWGQAFASVLLTPSPVLVTSRKLASPVMPAPGHAVSYTVLLSNTGNLTATALALTDHLPATLALVSGTVKVGGGSLWIPSGELITWRGALPPREELRLTYALTATAATAVGAWLTNTVWLVADGLAPLTRRAAVTYRHLVYLPLLSKNLVVPQSVAASGPLPPQDGSDDHRDKSQNPKEKPDDQRPQDRSRNGPNQRAHGSAHARSQHHPNDCQKNHQEAVHSNPINRPVKHDADDPPDDQTDNRSDYSLGHVRSFLDHSDFFSGGSRCFLTFVA
jgi:uncharacterized repeat protein (TIGR01451 family)